MCVIVSAFPPFAHATKTRIDANLSSFFFFPVMKADIRLVELTDKFDPCKGENVKIPPRLREFQSPVGRRVNYPKS
jgi:hypothetical protein